MHTHIEYAGTHAHARKRFFTRTHVSLHAVLLSSRNYLSILVKSVTEICTLADALCRLASFPDDMRAEVCARHIIYNLTLNTIHSLAREVAGVCLAMFGNINVVAYLQMVGKRLPLPLTSEL